jgi:predicted dithiol-disulfide oxidoreductase (DUF899 family)
MAKDTLESPEDTAKTIGRLEAEAEAALQRLAEFRMRLPEQQIQDYMLIGPDEDPVSLSALFGGRDELILIHNMGRWCSYCTLWADGFNGVLPHLEDRAAFVVVSPDSPEEQTEFARSRGWRFRMVSSKGSRFTEEMGFLIDGSHWPGYSTFRRADDGAVYRTAKAFFGPGDPYCGVWHLFALLPRGVNDWEPRLSYDKSLPLQRD